MYTLVPYRRQINRELATSPLMNDRFFRSFFGDDELPNAYGLKVDVHETDSAYLLDAELPGVNKDKIDVNVKDDVLTISADVNEEKKEEGKNYIFNERRFGHVERSFNIEGIDTDAITADYKNGVLSLKLPKIEPIPAKEARKIEISSSEGE